MCSDYSRSLMSSHLLCSWKVQAAVAKRPFTSMGFKAVVVWELPSWSMSRNSCPDLAETAGQNWHTRCLWGWCGELMFAVGLGEVYCSAGSAPHDSSSFSCLSYVTQPSRCSAVRRGTAVAARHQMCCYQTAVSYDYQVASSTDILTEFESCFGS